MHFWHKALATLLSVLMIGGVVGTAVAANHAVAPEKKQEPATGKAAKAAKAAAEKTGRHEGSVKVVDAASRTLTVAEKAGEVTVTVPDKASIKRGKATAKLEEVKAGEAVTVVFVQQDGKDVARSIVVKAQ